MKKKPQSTYQPSQYEEMSVTRLKAANKRITSARTLVMRALEDATVSLSAYDIHSKVKNSGHTVDVVSVYRILVDLMELDLIYYVGHLRGYFRKVHGTNAVQFNRETRECKELLIDQATIDAILYECTYCQAVKFHLELEVI